jgi:opacity protein-like surface antigen
LKIITKSFLYGALLAALAMPAAAADNLDAANLSEVVRGLDTKLFDAYNRCDLDTLGTMVADDLEFYHDQTGLSTGKAVFVAAIKNNVCGKVRRDLVPGTLEVYPIKHYGAVEIGEHVFCDPRQVQVCNPAAAGIAKFVNLWREQNGTWQLTRVISFDHVNDWQRPKAK